MVNFIIGFLLVESDDCPVLFHVITIAAHCFGESDVVKDRLFQDKSSLVQV